MTDAGLARFLRHVRLEGQLTADEVADALWLAPYVTSGLLHETTRPAPEGSQDTYSLSAPDDPIAPLSPQSPPALPPRPLIEEGTAPQPQADTEDGDEDRVPFYAPSWGSAAGSPGGASKASPVRAPAANPLPGALDLARAIRPLKIRVPAPGRPVLDEPATARALADAGLSALAAPNPGQRTRPFGGLAAVIVRRPRTERWLDLELVIDTHDTMAVWQPTIARLRLLLERHGAFRNVRTRWLSADGDGAVRFRVRQDSRGAGQPPHAGPRQLVLVVTDGLGPHWQSDSLASAMRQWQRSGPTALVQLLPQRLWDRTRLVAQQIEMKVRTPGSGRLAIRPVDPEPWAMGAEAAKSWIPVLELSADWVGPWARALRGQHTEWFPGMALDVSETAVRAAREMEAHEMEAGGGGVEPRLAEPDPRLQARELVRQFRFSASPQAFDLAALLAAAPLTLPAMRFVQSALAPGSQPAHLAEIFLSGLLERVRDSDDPDAAVYEFRDGIRKQLLPYLKRRQAFGVFEHLRYAPQTVARPFGGLEINALIPDSEGATQLPAESQPFAQVAATVLAGLGGRFELLARQIAARVPAGDIAAKRSEPQPPEPEVLDEPDVDTAAEDGNPSFAWFENQIATEQQEGLVANSRDVGQSSPVPALVVERLNDGAPGTTKLAIHAGDPSRSLTVTVSAGQLLALSESREHVAAPALSLVSALVGNPQEPGHSEEWRPHVIGNGVSDIQALLRGVHRSYRPLTCQKRVWRTLSRAGGGAVRLEGRSGSGKTTFAQALAAQWSAEAQLGGLVWLDLIDPNDGDESVVLTLLTTPVRPRYLVVMDNTQANVAMARRVFALVERLRGELGLEVSVLAAGWLGSEARDVGFPQDVAVARTEPDYVFGQLLAGASITQRDTEAIRHLAREDLVLMEYALRFLERYERVPLEAEFVEWMAGQLCLDRVTDPQLRLHLYEFACLGMFEIDIPRPHVEHMLLPEDLRALLSLGLIEPADTSYQVRSRSVAAVIARFALTRWVDPGDRDREYRAPSEIAANYLRFAGERQLSATLAKIDLLRVAHEGVEEGGRYLATALRQRRVIADRLRLRAREDPRWGGNTAAAAFGCMAAAQLGEPDVWERFADNIRQRWVYDPAGELPSWRGEHPPAEFRDFRDIRSAMRREDERTAPHSWPPELTGEQLDLDRAHRTWMTGILLGFEGTVPVRDHVALDCLYRSAERAQLATGAFYPERVPWVTARILIGLCEAGYGNSPVARKAADWLRDTGKSNLGWRSGTGKWSSDLMTTAMCVIALRLHRVPEDDPAVQVGYAALQDVPLNSAEGTSPIDQALQAQALLLGDRSKWPAAYDQVLSLLEWTVTPDTWRPTGSSTAVLTTPLEYEDSTKVPFVVSVLMDCVSRSIANELRPLFADLERLTDILPQPTKPEPVAAPDESSRQSSLDWHTIVQTAEPELVHRRFTEHHEPITHLTLSQRVGGPVLVSRSATTVIVSRVEDDQVLQTLEHRAGRDQPEAIEAVGQAIFLATGTSSGVSVRELDSNLPSSFFRAPAPRAVAVASLAGTAVLAVAHGEVVSMWGLDSRGAPRDLQTGPATLIALTNGMSDSLLALAGESQVAIWDLRRGERLEAISLAGTAQSLAFGRIEGRLFLAVGLGSGDIVLSPVGTSERMHLTGHDGPVRALAFAEDGAAAALVSGGDDGTARVWRLDSGSAAILQRRTGPVRAVAAATVDGRTVLATGTEDAVIRIWDALPAPSTESRADPSPEIACLALPADDAAATFAVGSSDGSVCLRGLLDGRIERMFATGGSRVSSLAYGPGSQIAVGLADGGIVVYDSATATELWRAHAHEGWVWAVAFADRGRMLVSGGADGAVRCWDAESGSRQRTVSASKEEVRALSSLSVGNANLVAIGGGRSAVVRQFPDLSITTELPRLGSAVRSICLGAAAGTHWVAVGETSGAVHVTTIDQASGIRSFTEHRSAVRAIAIGELAGRPILVTSADDNTVQARDLDEGELIDVWRAGRGQWISGAAFAFADSRLRRALAVGQGVEISAAELRPARQSLSASTVPGDL